MPRNASGTFTLASGNPVISGTTITSTWANSTLSDLGTEMTDSLDRSGKGGMLAQFKSFAGTSGAPGMSWADELDSGIYRAGSKDFKMQINATTVQQWTDTVVAFPIAVTAAPPAGNATGFAGTGHGTSPGVAGTGGGTSGAGVTGTGGATNGVGVLGVGTGSGQAVWGTTGGTGVGVEGSSVGNVGGKFTGGTNYAPIHLTPRAAPSSLSDGDMWIETGTNTFKVRINGVTKTVTIT